jgi:hypothetical protein
MGKVPWSWGETAKLKQWNTEKLFRCRLRNRTHIRHNVELETDEEGVITLCSLVVTLCISSFNIRLTYVLSPDPLRFICFSEETAIICLYKSNLFFYITQMRVICCANEANILLKKTRL